MGIDSQRSALATVLILNEYYYVRFLERSYLFIDLKAIGFECKGWRDEANSKPAFTRYKGNDKH